MLYLSGFLIDCVIYSISYYFKTAPKNFSLNLEILVVHIFIYKSISFSLMVMGQFNNPNKVTELVAKKKYTY